MAEQRLRVALNNNGDTSLGVWRLEEENGNQLFADQIEINLPCWTYQEAVGAKWKGWIETYGNFAKEGRVIRLFK